MYDIYDKLSVGVLNVVRIAYMWRSV